MTHSFLTSAPGFAGLPSMRKKAWLIALAHLVAWMRAAGLQSTEKERQNCVTKGVKRRESMKLKIQVCFLH